MTDQCPCLHTGFLNGVGVPAGGSHRILIVDRTKIETELWPRFNMANIHIRARTPVVYTMPYRNLMRLKDIIDDAAAQLEAAQELEAQHTDESD